MRKAKDWRRRKNYFMGSKSKYRMMRHLLFIFTVGIGLGIFNMYVIGHFTEILDSEVGDFSRSNAVIYGAVGLYLAVWLTISVTVFYCLLLFFSHRVLGAACKLRQALQQLAGGDLGISIQLRRGDYLHELAAEVNDTAYTLQKWFTELDVAIAQIRVAAGNDEDLTEPLAIAEQILRQYHISGTASPDAASPRRVPAQPSERHASTTS